jgi:hypothetical protein
MFDKIRELIETRWQTELSSLTTEYENVAFDRKGNTEWVKLTILDGDAFSATLGSTKKVKHPGILVASIFTPRGAGSKDSRVIADSISDAFRNTRVINAGLEIDFGTPTPSNGDPGDPNYYMKNVNVPFVAQQSKADVAP